MKSAYLFVAAVSSLIVAAGSGCCVSDSYCQGGRCGGPGFAGPTDCGSCGVPNCDSCGPGPLRRALQRRPLRRLADRWTCNNGCDGVYWDEWASDPPDCCDPCDPCGNWTGRGCWRPFWRLFNFWNLWGYRYECHDYSMDCDCGHCAGPAARGPIFQRGPRMPGRVIYDGPAIEYYGEAMEGEVEVEFERPQPARLPEQKMSYSPASAARPHFHNGPHLPASYPRR